MKVFWTKFALSSLESIYKYYKINANILIARKIKENIFSASNQLENYPDSGTIEPNLEQLKENHKFIIRGNYKIIYKIHNNKLYITDIFDSRQDPINIKLRNQ